MKKFRVTAEFNDVIVIVNAENEEDAQDKYFAGEIVEYEASPEQPYLKVEEVT